jgi:hypothetical protein
LSISQRLGGCAEPPEGSGVGCEVADKSDMRVLRYAGSTSRASSRNRRWEYSKKVGRKSSAVRHCGLVFIALAA